MTPSLKPTRSSITDDLLVNASTALRFANNFGSLIPIPAVWALVQTAQTIVSAAQNVRNNKQACAELASRSAELAKLINEEVHGSGCLMNDRIDSSLNSLEKVFQEVEAFVHDQNGSGIFKRIGKRDTVVAKVAELTAKLGYNMQIFQTISSLRTELRIDAMAKDLAVVKSNTQNEHKHLLHLETCEQRSPLDYNNVLIACLVCMAMLLVKEHDLYEPRLDNVLQKIGTNVTVYGFRDSSISEWLTLLRLGRGYGNVVEHMLPDTPFSSYYAVSTAPVKTGLQRSKSPRSASPDLGHTEPDSVRKLFGVYGRQMEMLKLFKSLILLFRRA